MRLRARLSALFTKNQTVLCTALNNVSIPPSSEMHIRVSFPRASINRIVSIEPFDHSRQGFAIANSVSKVQKDSQTIARVVNPTNQLVKVRKGQHLAHAVVIDSPISSTQNNSRVEIDKQIKQLNINSNLNDNVRKSVVDVIRNHLDDFSWSPNDIGHTNLVEHTIQLTADKPIKKPPYKTQPLKQKIIKEKIEEMLQQGIIEESKSPFSSPVVLAQKKSGEWRFCVDFRALNDITVKDAYPLPRIEETLEALHGNCYFSTLDLLSGFWQIPLAPEDRCKTAFALRGGLYEFKVMPFGLTNAPATFQRLMDRVLSSLNWKSCIVYLDDVIVFGKTLKEQNNNLSRVLDHVIKARLKLKPSKCQFAAEEVIYLGHRINKHGIGTDTSKVEAINRIPVPTDRVKLRRFLPNC